MVVALAGVTAAQFDTAAKNGFKHAVASLAGNVCGTANNLTACSLNDVEILSFTDVASRRTTSLHVSYNLYAASEAAANTAASTLNSATSDQWTAAVNAGMVRYGSSVRTTGVTTITKATASETSSSSSSGLSAGAIAGIVIACIVVVAIIIVGAYFGTRKKQNQMDGTTMSAYPNQSNNHHDDEYEHRQREEERRRNDENPFKDNNLPSGADNHSGSAQGGQI
jgi:hypothetical protein